MRTVAKCTISWIVTVRKWRDVVLNRSVQKQTNTQQISAYKAACRCDAGSVEYALCVLLVKMFRVKLLSAN